MKFKLVEQDGLSGNKMQILSPLLFEGDHLRANTLYEDFFLDNIHTYKEEIENIDDRLSVIGHQLGMRSSYYKDHEGSPGDGIIALFDDKRKNLRLYAILFGNVAVVLGNGGFKSKRIRAYQEDELLNKQNRALRKISAILNQAILDKRIIVTEYGLEFDPHEIFSDE